ncbi:hypothetical protein N9W89_13535 [Hellea sp.]|nr:hypothetical protein [Hellea sp.]
MKVRLDVKATAWMAGFPVGNHEVAFWRELSNAEPDLPEHAGKFGQYYRLNEWYKSKESKDKSLYVKDYIGPSVDTGFRISSFADTRRFPVSLEIAYFLSKIAYDDAVKSELGLHFHGLESMKGVLGGAPYPIFWIDTTSPDDALIKAQDKLMPSSTASDILNVREYIELFFRDEKNMLFLPFIHKCNDEQFCEMPEPYETLLIHTAKIWEKEQKKIDILKEEEGRSLGDVDEVGKVDEDQLSKLFPKK